MKRVLIFGLIASTIFIARCGPQVGNGASTCGANVVDTGMSLAVTRISGSSYKMTLCNTPNPIGAFSVYGASSAQTIAKGVANQYSARRPAVHVADAVQAGDPFQVDFLSTDTVFAIYLDKDLGGGQYDFDNKVTLIAPHPINF